MFSDKGFAAGANVEPYSGSAAVVIVDNVTVVTDAGKKRVVNNSILPTSVTEKPWKQDWIKGIVSEPIVDAWRNVPLWIKVPPDTLPRARSSLRFIRDRLPRLNAANRNRKPE
jgi:hypothetical protein